MNDVILHLVLIFLLLLFALLSIELKDLTKAILSFSVFSIFLAIIFYILGAPYVAVFQLAIYAGAVTVLFLAVMHTIKRRRVE